LVATTVAVDAAEGEEMAEIAVDEAEGTGRRQKLQICSKSCR